MQAIVYHRYGPPDVLEIAEIDKPIPAADQVLIRVCSASVNPYDWHFLRGTPSFVRIFTGFQRPKSQRLGADVAGEVESVGAQVTRFKPGDQVFGTCSGAFAQFACAPENHLALKPASITFEQAASLPIAGITALQGLRDSARLQPGQSVLINGAAGGVGTFAVQIAKHMGASVTGVCSTRNVELVRSLGAHAVIDYTQDDFTRSRRSYDAIFDLVGNHALSDLRRALHPRGVFVGCGGGGPDRTSLQLLAPMLGHAIVAPFIPQRIAGILAKISVGDLEHLAAFVEAGHVRPVVDRTFPLTETAAAIRYVEQCHARGKVILNIA
jgi:NADPH:quinone reductase-like Zn-dependent oxidoreductase